MNNQIQILLSMMMMTSLHGAPIEKRTEPPPFPYQDQTTKIDVLPSVAEVYVERARDRMAGQGMNSTGEEKGLTNATKGMFHKGNNNNKRYDLKKWNEYLQHFGYLDASVSGQKNESDRTIVKALKDYQKFAGLPVTGKLDNATKTRMKQPRCHNPDLEPLNNRSKRYAVSSKWPMTSLTYSIQSYPGNTTLTRVQVDAAFAQAFSLWKGANTKLSFTKITQLNANIRINFCSYLHSAFDPYPFNGPGGVLAHTSYPSTGMTHFDNSEKWVAGNIVPGVTFDLLQVATHELGHSLGMGHSTNASATMYPYYVFRKPFALNADDIAGIKSLY